MGFYHFPTENIQFVNMICGFSVLQDIYPVFTRVIQKTEILFKKGYKERK